jgi:hypothetical protein
VTYLSIGYFTCSKNIYTFRGQKGENRPPEPKNKNEYFVGFEVYLHDEFLSYHMFFSIFLVENLKKLLFFVFFFAKTIIFLSFFC